MIVPMIYKKMSQVMADLSSIEKSRKAEFGATKYNFRGIDDVYNAVHEVLAKHGVFSVPEVLSERSEQKETKNGIAMYRILVIKYTFYCEDGSHVSAVVVGEGMDSGDKAANKAMSVAHKYAILQVFCIPTVEPKDPENEHQEVVGKAKAPLPTPAVTEAPKRIKLDPEATFDKQNVDQKLYVRSLLMGAQVPERNWMDAYDTLTGIKIGHLQAGVTEFKGMIK